ncbi:hypothetical protein LAZ67_14003205 [Cordylochernes scorpioides]|uniref:Uncharacterized protein n=1 Tax=Cordylochernes scorpioides TaxID=51811 RepID=A0ABY6LA11_9ARAC|nr:hypothetical protein LAZ67_14003205 [Cordylochernes scorpioides]
MATIFWVGISYINIFSKLLMHLVSSQPVYIACGFSDLSHRYWSCSAVRPLIREVFSIIGPDLQSWIFAVGLEDHAVTSGEARDLRLLLSPRNAWSRWGPAGDLHVETTMVAEMSSNYAIHNG